MPELLNQVADQIPNFVGLKFTGMDLMALQLCLRSQSARYDILWEYDEILLGVLALGARGAVGST